VKYLPGISMDNVEADARSPRIRGLPAQYTSVTFDGMKLASADGFIQNNGTDNGGGAGAGGRSFGFEQVSMSSIDSVEVNFTTNASQDADSPAGNINLKPKHAFERNGQLISYQLSAMANSEQLYLHKSVGPDDKSRRKFFPNGLVEYSNSFFNHRLGVNLSFNQSKSYNEQRMFTPTYDTTPTATDPRPLVLTRIQFKDGPKITERSTASFTLDFKATDRLALTLVGTINNYIAFVGNRSFGVTTTRANVKTGDGLTSWDNVPITAITTSAGAAFLNKRTNGYTYLPSFEYKLGSLTLNGSMVLSQSINNYAGGQAKDLPGNNVAGVSLPVTGITVSASRPADDNYKWTVVQTGGADWAKLSNYNAAATASPTFAIDGRYNLNLIYQGRLDAKYVTGWRVPTWLKVGGKITENTYLYQNPTAAQVWSYSGPGGGLGGNWNLFPSGFVFSPGHGGGFYSSSGGTPAEIDHNAVGALFASHPEYFTPSGTAANYLTAYIQQPRYVREQIDAAYAMFDTKPSARLELQGGLRWERTRDEFKDFDPLGSAAVVAAGFPVTAATGVASTVPGMVYQYMSRPRVARSTNYSKVYPSGSVKYEISRNLQLLAGYSYTVTRPAYGDLTGAYSENDTTQEISGPNPKLKPQYANNYSARLSYYFEPVGSLGVGVFENDFKNFVQSSRQSGVAADFGFTDPIYANYTIIAKNNIPGQVVYRGATVEYFQGLSFLPKPFNTLTVFANYTRTYTKLELPNPALLNAATPYNFGWLPGISPNVINYGVSFRFKNLSTNLKAKWTDKTPYTSTYNTFQKQNTRVDVDLTYRLTDKVSLFLYSKNIFNVPDYNYANNNPQQIASNGRGIEYYGAYFYSGVKGRF